MRAATVWQTVLLAALVGCSTPDALQPTALFAQTVNGKSAVKPTIVLVHGAFADASGWQAVITQLQQDGYKVVAVQNPLSSLPNDVETTKRLIDAQTGPVVVVAHSYGGAVISGAAAGNPNVKALVYIAALAPDANEVLGPLLNQYPTPVLAKFVPDAAGFLYIDYAAYPLFLRPGHPAQAGGGDGGGPEAPERGGLHADESGRRVADDSELVHGRAGR